MVKKIYHTEEEKTEANRGYSREYARRNSKICYERNKEYRRQNPWFVHGASAKQRCTNKNHKAYCWYGAKGIKYRLTTQDLKRIWRRDKAHLLNRPSLDRINPEGDYEYQNVRFIELGANSRRSAIKRWKDDRKGWSDPTRGENNPMAKLTEKEALAIVKGRIKNTHTTRELAEKYGVTMQTVRNISKGKRWAHLQGRIHLSDGEGNDEKQ